MVFRNEFSWSKSREGLFRECKRKYFFNHYGFWNGWIASEDDKVKRIYYLKKLAGKELWLGSHVHGVIEFVLKRFRIGTEISLGHALAILEKRMESDFVMSKLGGYTGFKTNAHRFFEDEYGIEISEEEKKALFDKGSSCLTNFFNSDVFMEIRRSNVEDWVTLEDFLSFDFCGTRIFLSIDFAMRVGDKIVIYDWKTGGERKSDYELQLGLYALYISEKLGISADKIEAKMFYLAIDKVDSFDVDVTKLDEVRSHVESSILEMKKLLKDVTDSPTRDDSGELNEAVEEDFEKSEGYWCARCNFRKVCLGEWKEKLE